MNRISLHILISILAGLTACVAPAALPAEPTPRATAPGSVTSTSTPQLAPTPAIEVDFSELTLVPGRLAGDWTVIGMLTNRSAFAAQGITLDVTLQGSRAAPLAHQLISPALDTLAPGAASPFSARFPAAGSAEAALAEVVSYQPASGAAIPLKIDSLAPQPMQDGRIAVYGRVSNSGAKAIVIQDLVILARTPAGDPVALSSPASGISFLGVSESAGFVCILDSVDPASVLSAYSDAKVASDPGELPLAFPEPPKIAFDEQGVPLVLGAVRNDGGVSMLADVVVTITLRDETLGIGELELPWPLAPGETQPFAVVDFPGLETRVSRSAVDPLSLSAEGRIDPAVAVPSSVTPIALEAALTSQETIGARLYLKGSLTNSGPDPVARPSIMAVVNSTDGDILTAGFMTAADELGPGASLSFVLTLRLPDRVNLAMAEFDVRGAGMPVE